MFKKLILSILSAFFLYLSWPPSVNFTFFIFFALIPLFILEASAVKQEISSRNYFLYVYVAFFLFNMATTYWIQHAHVGGAIFAILCNSFFMTFVFFLSLKIKDVMKWDKKFFILPILWVGFEYLHLNWDLSWPWLTLGNVFASHPAWVQWYSITGVLGGTIWIFLVNFSIFQVYQNRFSFSLRTTHIIIAVSLIIIPISISSWISYKDNNMLSTDSANILIVQPNIDPYKEKFTLSQQDQTQSVLSFIKSRIDSTTDFVILPETFLISPIWFHRLDQNLDINLFKNLVYKYPNINILTGATVLKFSSKSATSKPLLNHANQFYKVYNSALQLNLIGIQSYYKSKLVPGAEQMPFHNLLYPILGDNILQIGNSTAIGNFSKQDTVANFISSKNHHIAPIICYESIYGDYVRRFINKGAQIIIIMTNDGWWKKTSGYQQHNMYANLRAIENRRYIARSANTGISSIINPFGELEAMIDWNKRDVISQKVYLYSKKTFYVQYGDFIGRLCAFISIIIILYCFVDNKLRFSY